MITFDKAQQALDRYNGLYVNAEYNKISDNVLHTVATDEKHLQVMSLILDVTMGMCDFPFYAQNLTSNIVDLFSLIKSPVLYTAILAYINRFK
jgi:hypothetical protein